MKHCNMFTSLFPPFLSCAPHPRLGDIRLVASGFRCAALLDSCRVPRDAPPLADVLLALQRDQHQQQRRHRDHGTAGSGEVGCDCGSCGIACLGLLVLEGSCFLVNRAMLSRRLDEIFSCELAYDDSSGSPGASTAECSNSSNSTSTSSTRCSHFEIRVASKGETAEPTAVEAARITSERRDCPPPPTSDCGAVAQRQPQAPQEPALLDVRKSQALPCDRSDILLPRLHAALWSAFGGIPGGAAAAAAATARFTADPPTPAGSPFGTCGEPPRSDTTTTIDRPGKSNSSGGGARWLRDWETKEMVLDSGHLRGILGGAGLCGFAGWLLEYPVVYCCASRVGGMHAETQDDDGEDDNDLGNCLAGVPLTVYSVSVDFGDNLTGCWRGSHRGSSPSAGSETFEAFSFSVPEASCDPGDAGDDEEEGFDARAGVYVGGGPNDRHRRGVGDFHDLVDRFVERLERRIARYRASGNDDVLRLIVRKRVETLDRVAL